MSCQAFNQTFAASNEFFLDRDELFGSRGHSRFWGGNPSRNGCVPDGSLTVSSDGCAPWLAWAMGSLPASSTQRDIASNRNCADLHTPFFPAFVVCR